MKIVFAMAAFAAATLTVSTANAAQIFVDFAFTGMSSYPGKVTGQIAFAAAGTNVAATSVYVLTSTNAAIPANPTVNFANNSGAANSFTVSSTGVVSAASFSSGNSNPINGQFLFLNAAGFQNDFQQGQIAAIYNNQGFVGITYKPGAAAVSAVPEPAAWGMMILGMGAIGLARRRRKSVTTNVSFA